MPIAAPQLPADRRQPAERTTAQAQAGSLTLVADAHGFAHVGSVGWVRDRAGDELAWANDNQPRPKAITRAGPPSRYAPSAADAVAIAAAAASARPHPALLEFQQEQAQANERAQVAKNANVEGRTSSSTYGAHYQQQAHNGSGGAVNSIGAEQILSQQARLWGSLDATSKRMGFGISHAPVGSPLRALEQAQDQKRYKSVAATSFSPEGKDRRPEIRVPDSMNRTSCNFPLHPVNQYSAAMQPSSMRNPRAAAAAAAASAAASPSATPTISAAASSSSSSPLPPLSPARAALQAYEHSDTSTAHSLGYGSRHLFHRHYLSSAPQL